MTNKHCVMFGCKSDSRFHPGRKFANFVKPSKDKKRAGQWIKIVNRKDFEIKDIKKKTYICDLHFPQNVDLQWWKNSLLTPTPISYEGFDDPAPIGQPERRKRKIQDFKPISCTEYNPKRMYYVNSTTIIYAKSIF